MELPEKAETLPLQPGVYLFRDALGKVLYVGKAKILRHRVRSYFLGSRVADAKTGSLCREIADLEYVVVDNEREALALEHNLIKQHKPKFNVLLRDDKTYPYIKLTVQEKYPRVYVTRRIKKDGAQYFGPYFPGRLAHRIVHLIHRHFQIPSCTVDLTRFHPRPCLQYYIKRCQGPCVQGLTADQRYAETVTDLRAFLEGRLSELISALEARMLQASNAERFEQAAAYRDLVSTVRQVAERQKMARADGDDTDILGYFQERSLAAVNLFHLRGGRVVDRQEFFWEDMDEFDPAEFFSGLLKQIYLDAAYVPRFIHIPVEFEDLDLLETILTERSGHRVGIVTPQRGPKRALLQLVAKNAQYSFDHRFRVLKPAARAILEALQTALMLPRPPRRIESFDISHIHGVETVASMVVWENGKMKKSDYRKFIIRQRAGNDDFASLHEAVFRRYRRLQSENKPFPDMILLDGGLGQLHAASKALEDLQVINQPLASIAKKEETLYVLGQESEPIHLERHSPVLHLVQMIRDETHRFAVTFHRQRRSRRELRSKLVEIPGIGEQTALKLLRAFGSLDGIRRASPADLSRFLNRRQAEKVRDYLSPLIPPARLSDSPNESQ